MINVCLEENYLGGGIENIYTETENKETIGSCVCACVYVRVCV